MRYLLMSAENWIKNKGLRAHTARESTYKQTK